jgi:hypothetical protein
MKLLALLSALLVTAIIAATPVHAQAAPVGVNQECASTGQSPECCEASNLQQGSETTYGAQEDCGQQFEIVKTIIPVIGILLLAGGIIGAVIWERRRLS